jgi:hypothetical protein
LRLMRPIVSAVVVMSSPVELSAAGRFEADRHVVSYRQR